MKIKKQKSFKNGTVFCLELEAAGYDYAVAFATQSEIENGAACGQLSIITGDVN